MSEPTYLIRVAHDPTELTLPYEAKITRLADDSHAATRWGTSVEEAVQAAQAWIRAKATEPQEPLELYADEDGTIAVGESVRVLRPT